MTEEKEKKKITAKDILAVLKKRWWIILIEVAVIGIIILFDLLSKKYAVAFLKQQEGEFYVFIKGLINFNYTENTGAGFGMFSGNTVTLSVLTAILMFIIFAFLTVAQTQNEFLRISLTFILGGGIGNLVDRIKFGYVRDFIQFAFWEKFAIFNVADMFVTVGTFMLIIVLIVMLVLENKKSKKEFEEENKNKANVQETLSDPLDAPKNLNPMMPSPNDYEFVPSESSDCKKSSNNKNSNGNENAEGGNDENSGDSHAEGGDSENKTDVDGHSDGEKETSNSDETAEEAGSDEDK